MAFNALIWGTKWDYICVTLIWLNKTFHSRNTILIILNDLILNIQIVFREITCRSHTIFNSIIFFHFFTIFYVNIWIQFIKQHTYIHSMYKATFYLRLRYWNNVYLLIRKIHITKKYAIYVNILDTWHIIVKEFLNLLYVQNILPMYITLRTIP